MDERAFPFIRINRREAKPRQRGLTEIRGPYYSVMGARYLADLLETMGEYVDGVKYAGGSFALMPRQRVQELNDLAHKYNAYVSTGGWIEHVLAHGSAHDVSRYIGEARALGFDLIELSTGFISLPPNDLVALLKAVRSAGLQELRRRGEPVRRPQPDRSARMPARGDLGDQEHLGTDYQLKAVKAGIRGGGRPRSIS